MITRKEETLGEYLPGGARPYLVIALIGLLLYAGVSFFGLSCLDDNILILDNHEFISNPTNIVEAFRTSVFRVLREYDAAYRPLLTVSFMIDAQIDKYLGLGYHFTNVILHILTSCLVFLLFLKLKYTRSLAFAFALIFAVHPALTQAVAWIPGRNDSLLGIFAVASTIALIDFLESKRWRDYAAHIIFLMLALFTKESALALVVVSACYCALIARGVKNRNTLFLLAGWVITIAAWALCRESALTHNPVMLSGAGIVQDLISSAPAILIYLGKAVFPLNMSIVPTMQDSTLAYGMAAALILTLGLLLSVDRRNRFALFGVIWFIAFLVPTFIRPMPDGPAVFMESRIYLPMIGVFIILGEIDIVKKLSLKRTGHLVSAAVITGALFYISMNHANHFQNALTFWEYAVKRSPHSSAAQYNLGWVYGAQGRDREAEAGYKKALELNPRQRYAHNSLGCIYEYRGLLDEAESEYSKEIEIAPYYDKAYLNLSNLYLRRGKREEAGELLKILKKRKVS